MLSDVTYMKEEGPSSIWKKTRKQWPKTDNTYINHFLHPWQVTNICTQKLYIEFKIWLLKKIVISFAGQHPLLNELQQPHLSSTDTGL